MPPVQTGFRQIYDDWRPPCPQDYPGEGLHKGDVQKVNLSFRLAPEVAALGVKCVCFVIEGLANKPEDAEFERYKSDLFTRLKAQYTTETVSDDPVLAGFRSLHSKVGRSNRKFPASPESLIKMFLRNGAIPPINLTVDIYNCVSLVVDFRSSHEFMQPAGFAAFVLPIPAL